MSWPEISLPTETATEQLARKMAPLLRPADLLVLTGDLGAGKTFFAGALLRALGLPEEERVTSPTYSLVCEYPTTPPAIHADLYRLSSEEEVDDLGLEEKRAAGCLLVVEWGRPFIEVLGGGALEIEFSLEPRGASVIEHGERLQVLRGQLIG